MPINSPFTVKLHVLLLQLLQLLLANRRRRAELAYLINLPVRPVLTNQQHTSASIVFFKQSDQAELNNKRVYVETFLFLSLIVKCTDPAFDYAGPAMDDLRSRWVMLISGLD